MTKWQARADDRAICSPPRRPDVGPSIADPRHRPGGYPWSLYAQPPGGAKRGGPDLGQLSPGLGQAKLARAERSGCDLFGLGGNLGPKNLIDPRREVAADGA
jgi:hypothetical protein